MFSNINLSRKLHILCVLDEFRDIELEIVSSGGLTIDSEYGVTASTPTPTSLTLLKTGQLPARPISVCHYKGSTYVGLASFFHLFSIFDFH